MKRSEEFDFPESIFNDFIYLPGYSGNANLAWNIVKSPAGFLLKDAGTENPDKWMEELKTAVKKLFIITSERSRSRMIGINFTKLDDSLIVILKTDSRGLVISPLPESPIYRALMNEDSTDESMKNDGIASGYSAGRNSFSPPYKAGLLNREFIVSKKSGYDLVCRVSSACSVEFISKVTAESFSGNSSGDLSTCELLSGDISSGELSSDSSLALISIYCDRFIHYSMSDGCSISVISKKFL